MSEKSENSVGPRICPKIHVRKFGGRSVGARIFGKMRMSRAAGVRKFFGGTSVGARKFLSENSENSCPKIPKIQWDQEFSDLSDVNFRIFGHEFSEFSGSPPRIFGQRIS